VTEYCALCTVQLPLVLGITPGMANVKFVISDVKIRSLYGAVREWEAEWSQK